MPKSFVKLISTFFCIGYFPAGPGTMASLAGAVIAYQLRGSMGLYLLAFMVITVLGFLVSDKMEEIARQKDPSCVVIDEVSGIMIAFFLLPMVWPVTIITFFLFRAFDMFKVYPVNKFEEMKGGTGIMMDDIIAGLYTNVTMQIAIRLAQLV